MHEVQRHRAPHRRVESPADLAHTLELLSTLGRSGRIVSGGTDLLLESARGVRPDVDVLVDITRIPGLDEITFDGSAIRIGATVTHNQVVTSDVIREYARPLAQACWEIGSPQLRNRATVVGNVVTASPANDTITPLRALGTEVEIRSGSGTRVVPLDQFHTGLRSTVLRPDEMVTTLRFPILGANERSVYLKSGNRRAQAISVVHMTARVAFEDGIVTAASLFVGSVAPTIVWIDLGDLEGTTFDDAIITRVAADVAGRLSPIDDIRATAAYRSDQVRVMTRRALRALRDDAPPQLPDRPVTLATPAPIRPAGPTTHDPTTPVRATVNGVAVEAPAAVPASLLDWLRDGVGLTGAKEGCAEGECGACTVFLDGAAVMACLVPSTRAHGAQVVTVEGLAGEDLHPVQQAFVDTTAVQCGYCTPGFVMAVAKLLEEQADPTTAEIRSALAGNLCRCTGYYPIIEAVRRASGATRVPG